MTIMSFKKYQKIGLKILFLFLLSFFLSSCRTKCNQNSSDYPECLGTNNDIQETNNDNKNIELVFWNLFDDKKTLLGQIQQFESLHPGIKIEYLDFQNKDNYEDILINKIAEGKGPDIFSIHYSWVTKHKNKISPMPSDIMIPEKFRQTFFDVVAENLIAKDENGNENIYGVSLFVDTLSLFYNKSIFRDLLRSSSQPADNWEDIKEQVYALTKTDNSVERFSLSGIAMGRADNIRHSTNILSLLFLQYKAKLFDEKNAQAIISKQQGTIEGSGKAFFPGEEAIKLFTSFALPSYKNYSWNRNITGLLPEKMEIGVFCRGKTAMIFGFSSLYEEIITTIEELKKTQQNSISPEDIGISLSPQIMSRDFTEQRDSLGDFYALTVSRNSKNAHLAWEFLNFLSSAESARDYHIKTKKPTARFDLIDEQIVEKDFGVFAQQVPYAKTVPIIDQKTFSNIFSQAIDEIANSKKSAKETLKLTEKKLECNLKKLEGENLDQNCNEIQ